MFHPVLRLELALPVGNDTPAPAPKLNFLPSWANATLTNMQAQVTSVRQNTLTAFIVHTPAEFLLAIAGKRYHFDAGPRMQVYKLVHRPEWRP
jgi:hypothetical protein